MHLAMWAGIVLLGGESLPGEARLHNGRAIAGEVRQEDEEIIVKTDVGTVHLRRSEVAQVVSLSDPNDSKSIRWANVFHEGRWMSRDTYWKSLGFVQSDGKWISREERQRELEAAARQGSELRARLVPRAGYGGYLSPGWGGGFLFGDSLSSYPYGWGFYDPFFGAWGLGGGAYAGFGSYGPYSCPSAGWGNPFGGGGGLHTGWGLGGGWGGPLGGFGGHCGFAGRR